MLEVMKLNKSFILGKTTLEKLYVNVRVDSGAIAERDQLVFPKAKPNANKQSPGVSSHIDYCLPLFNNGEFWKINCSLCEIVLLELVGNAMYGTVL